MFSIPSLREFSRQTIRAACSQKPVNAGVAELLVDATMGNGHDTLFLASLAYGRGASCHVHAFDVQEKALERTASRLAAAGLTGQAVLHLAGHEVAADILAASKAESSPPCLRAAMFNLGFLPAADRSIVTRAENTLAALRGLLPLLLPGGVVSIQMYAGHAHGDEETEAVIRFLAELPEDMWKGSLYQICNKRRNPEYLGLVTYA